MAVVVAPADVVVAPNPSYRQYDYQRKAGKLAFLLFFLGGNAGQQIVLGKMRGVIYKQGSC